MFQFLKICSLLFFLASWNIHSRETELPFKKIADIPYDSKNPKDPLRSLDLYLINHGSKSKSPLAVMIHGGGWRRGDKSNQGLVLPKANLFFSRGYSFASVNYRLSPDVVHPAHSKDVARALEFLYLNHKKYGIDPNHFVILGHSAGAHIAAILATNSGILKNSSFPTSSLKGVILIDSGLYDLKKRYEESWFFMRNMISSAVGNTNDLLLDGSPMTYVAGTPASISFLGLVCKNRAPAIEITRSFLDALKENGNQVSLKIFEGHTHRTINRQMGNPKEEDLNSSVIEFLDRLPSQPVKIRKFP